MNLFTGIKSMDDHNKKRLFLIIFSAVVVVLTVILIIAALSRNDKDNISIGSNDISSTVNVSESLLQQASSDSSLEDYSLITPPISTISKISSTTQISSLASSLTSAQTTPTNQDKLVSILKDPTYKNGFKVRGLGGIQGTTDVVGLFNPFNSSGRPSWDLAQWSSKYDFMDSSMTKLTLLSSTVAQYVNTNKIFTIDSKNGILTFQGIPSKSYDHPRQAGEPWFHILIQQGFSNANSLREDCHISELKTIQVTLSNRLTQFKDQMDGQVNPGLHAAQFLMYLSIQNQNIKSPGCNEMIWFGFGIFDNRNEWELGTSMFDQGTQSLMVGLGNTKMYGEDSGGVNTSYKNGIINASPDNDWSHFSLNISTEIKIAYETARVQGYFKNTNYEDLYISGMNIGWELPGTYDVTMETKDLDIKTEKK